MLLAVVLGLVISALSFSGVVMSTGVMRFTAESWEARQAFYTAEAGVQTAIRELESGDDADGDGLGSIPLTAYAGGSYQVIMTVSGDTTSLRAIGTVGGVSSGVEVALLSAAATTVTYTARAAVVSNGPVTTSGNITIDGRDWAEDNSAVVGPGVYGISSSDQVSAGGNSKVGGDGIAPIKKPDDDDDVYEEGVTWADGTDNDGDFATDEESYDGYDNDGDGEIDEDTSDYPDNPDALLGLAPGTLMAAAQAHGTYFSNQTDYDAYLSANGGNLPGGGLYYLDFSMCVPANVGATMNTEPSILVNHNAAGSAELKNVHGEFKGLILADTITHINANTTLLGAVFSFAPYASGNAYGNGNATVRYSSAVLDGLPGVSTSTGGYSVVSWRRFVP